MIDYLITFIIITIVAILGIYSSEKLYNSKQSIRMGTLMTCIIIIIGFGIYKIVNDADNKYDDNNPSKEKEDESETSLTLICPHIKNECPDGCEKPIKIDGNCDSKTFTEDDITYKNCPYVCKKPFGECKYSQCCKKCGYVPIKVI
tara:strand:+ start:73 stop:510 length:438 start_codon:yes stop_codon:yes gene_type:complete